MTDDTRDPNELIQPADLIGEWGVRRAKVYEWLASGQLRGVNLASDPNGAKPRWRIRRADADAFLRRRENRR